MTEICGMSVLIVASTHKELAPFMEKHPEADVLITGVGVPQAIYQLMKAIRKKKYRFVIQAGIAGTFNTTIELGQAVIIQKDRFADLGCMENGGFSSIFDMGLADSTAFPFRDGWLVNPSIASFSHLAHAADAITVSMLTDDTGQVRLFSETFHAALESMEGAALHYVCLQEGIDFLQVRGVSNHVGERNKKNWKMEQAIRSSNELLEKAYVHILNSSS